MPEDLDALRLSWMRVLRAEHKSPNTVRSYRDGITQFIDFLQNPREEPLEDEEESPAQLLARRPVSDESDLHRDHVAAFISELLQERTPRTVVARYKALQMWFKWMCSQPDINMAISPMLGMSAPVAPEKHPPILTVEHIQAMLTGCDLKTFKGLRDAAIIRLLADTGIRAGELLGLMSVEVLDGVRVPCVDLDTETVYVVGKGRRPRTVAFGAKTTLALDRYLRARRKHPHAHLMPDLWLLSSDRKRARPLGDTGLRSMLAVRGMRIGVQGVHPHIFRHTWADAQKRRGLDRADLKNQGGWRSDAMVDRYGAIAETDRAIQAHRRQSFGDEI